MSDRTPRPTRLALVAVLATTGALLAAFVAGGGLDDPSRRLTASVLGALTALFALRVAGQVLVRARRPAYLPPTEDWNLMPYRLLLPIQLAFLAVMVALCVDLARRGPLSDDPSRTFGLLAIAFAAVYAAAMGVRYAVRMTRRPAERWFGGTVPIVFHQVLASFVLVFGSFHAFD